MKKYISLILAAVLLISMCGCGTEMPRQVGRASESVNIDEALAYLSTVAPEHADVQDTGLIAPACGTNNVHYGYVDIKGEWVIEPQYNNASNADGDYLVYLNDYSKYVYADRSGTPMLERVGGEYISEYGRFSGKYASVAVNSTDQRYLYIDRDYQAAINAYGLPYVPGRYYSNTYCFGVATPFVNGLAVVMRQKNMSIKDGMGPETAYIINEAGEIVGNLPEGVDPNPTGFDDNGNIIVFNSEGKFGLCDKSGKMLIDCKYRSLKHCEGSLYLACGDNGFWGFVNSKGEIAIGFQYQKGMPFSDGLAAVYDGAHWGFIDETGATAIEFIFDDVSAFNNKLVESSLSSAAFKDGFASVKVKGYWVVIDTEENPVAIISEADCEGVEGSPFTAISGEYITFCKNINGEVLYGLSNTSGQIVLDPEFGYLGSFK